MHAPLLHAKLHSSTFLALSLKQMQEKRSYLFFSLTALIGLLNLYWSRTKGASLALVLSLIFGIGFYLYYVKKEKNKFLMPAYFLICILILSGLSLWISQEWKKGCYENVPFQTLSFQAAGKANEHSSLACQEPVE